MSKKVLLVILFLLLGFVFLKSLPLLSLNKSTTLTIPRIIPSPEVVLGVKTAATVPAQLNPSFQSKSTHIGLRVPVLLYHYIGNNPNPSDHLRDNLSVSPDKFHEQMEYLAKNGYSAISPDTLYAVWKKQAALPAKPVILTFDDGYEDFYYNAYPILRQFNLHATVFIPTGLMGQGYYLGWEQIRQLSASGLITFGAHSIHHLNLPSLSTQTIESELLASKKTLQDALGIPINFMAYPNGSTNSLVISLVKRAGYIGAFGTWPGKIQSEDFIYNLPRIKVSGSINLQTFANLL